jgi:hypothetical protein
MPAVERDLDPYSDTATILNQLAAEVDRLRILAAAALRNLYVEANWWYDGHPGTASGRVSDGSRGSAELTPTESVAHKRLGNVGDEDDDEGRPGPDTEARDIFEQMITARDALNRATKVCERNLHAATLTDGEKRRLYCSATVHHGWAEVACRDYAVEDGLCDMHLIERRAQWAQERRQRRQH